MSDNKKLHDSIAAVEAKKARQARLNTLASAFMALNNIPDNGSLLWALQVDGARSNREALKRLFDYIIENEEIPGHELPMNDLLEIVHSEIRARMDQLAFRLGLH